MKTSLIGAILAGLMMTTAPAALAMDVTAKGVADNYANIALTKFEDSLTTAKTLDTAIDALLAAPSEATLDAAKEAW